MVHVLHEVSIKFHDKAVRCLVLFNTGSGITAIKRIFIERNLEGYGVFRLKS